MYFFNKLPLSVKLTVLSVAVISITGIGFFSLVISSLLTDELINSNAETIENILYVAVALTILQGLFIYIIIRKFATIPIVNASDLLRVIAKGDLSTPLFEADGDEISWLFNSFHDMQKKLSKVISGIRHSADEVSIVAEQVAQGNTNLSQRTQEQASSLEQVASSMEEMISTVNQNSENAQQANQLAIAARDEANHGDEIVAQAVAAMGEINNSSKQISEIISVIDELAFQTNLLALNAAVEAARAGEHGRGFAVVASEVRNLAGRSATAAKEIKGLIQDSVVKVEEGSKLVNDSGQALDKILGSVKKVSDIIAEIAAASQEQADGIVQVNHALTQMDDTTQQNASLVEEAAAASETMGAQSEELLSLVSYFKLDEEEYATKDYMVERVHENDDMQPDTEVSEQTSSHVAVTERPKVSLPPRAKDYSDDSEWQEF